MVGKLSLIALLLLTLAACWPFRAVVEPIEVPAVPVSPMPPPSGPNGANTPHQVTLVVAPTITPVPTVTAPTPNPYPQTISFFQPFTLRLSEQAVLPPDAEARPGLELRFKYLQSESRCPEGVQCIQAGEAVLIFEARAGNDDPISLLLSTDPDRSAGIVGPYQIHLHGVTPYPDSSQTTLRPEQYAAAMLIVPVDPATLATLDRPFAVQVGQQAYLKDADLHIWLQKSPEDSRCPSRVVCVQSGEAKVTLTLWHSDNESAAESLVLSTRPQNAAADLFGYHIQLLAVNPYPRLPEQPIPPDEYSITLQVNQVR